MNRLRAALALWRDSILFLAGLSLTVYEAVGRAGPERYGLIVLYAGMMGLPMVLRADERPTAPPSPSPPASGPTPGVPSGEVVP